MKTLFNSGTKFLFLMVAFFGLTAVHPAGGPGKRKPLRSTTIRFLYREFEGTVDVLCKHRLVSDASPFDFKVECFDNGKKLGEYVAHIALSQYEHTGDTKLSIELLYWLNGTGLPNEVGSTTWFHFAEKGGLQGISSSQTIAGGTAGLYLEIGTAAFRLSRWAR